uniref:hypothetical protein n=1 Tax=uncultured Chloroflexus sp. TaxID=214040 RepID=UPI00263130AA
ERPHGRSDVAMQRRSNAHAAHRSAAVGHRRYWETVQCTVSTQRAALVHEWRAFAGVHVLASALLIRKRFIPVMVERT